MKLLHSILLFTVMLLASKLSFALNAADRPVIAIPKSGVIMSTQFPEPKIYINMMPTINGEPATPFIDVSMTLTNHSSTPIQYTFPSSKTFDIIIKNQIGQVVTKWSRDKFFLLLITELTILPGESETFSGRVELLTKDNMFIYPGNYTVSISLENIDNGLSPDTIRALSETSTLTLDASTIRSPQSQMPLRIDWVF